jgi:hypothetical protein
MLLGALGLCLFSGPGTVNAQQPDKNEERAARARSIFRQILDLESLGRARVLRERGAKPFTRPAVKTAYNVESFAPVSARFVRFDVLATVNGAEPSLDVLEVYSPDSSVNRAEGARTTASSTHPQLGRFNGGKYGKGWGWVSKEPGKGWVQMELPATATIDRIVWSRDAANRYHNRVPSVYKIEVSEDGGAWHTVATGEDRQPAGRPDGVSHLALVKALYPRQQKKRHELLDELRTLGAAWPNEVKSGPQVGEGINGGFLVQCSNGLYTGKRCCPV